MIHSPRKKLEELKPNEPHKNAKCRYAKKEDVKKFNDLTRQKNALMMQNTSKKAS